MPDKEKARSMLVMAEYTEKSLRKVLEKMSLEEHQSMIAREYYELIRELATAILILDGFKAIGESAHKETIDNLSRHKEFLQDEIYDMQELRLKRNRNSYEGKPIKSPYIENKKQKFDLIILKLKENLKKRLA